MFVKNLTNSQELEISYEEINTKKIIRQSRTDYRTLIAAVLFGIVFSINFFVKITEVNSSLDWSPIIIVLMFALFFAVITYVNTKRQIMIPTFNDFYIEVFDARPSKEATDKFIVDLNARINNYLKLKYATLDKSLPIEPQLSNLVWLKERGTITEVEFEALKTALIGSGSNSPMGFR